ncbi:MAG: efflux RND transporter periplasmic adaptor subunit [Rhodanobacter sp.]
MNVDSPERRDTRRLLETLALPASAPPPPVRRRWWLVGSAAVVMVGAVTWLVWPRPDSAEPAPQVSQPAAKPENAAQPAKPIADSAALQASGFVVAKKQATVSTDVTGRLMKIHVEEGDTVKKGQLLAELDPRIPAAQASYASANIETARKAATITRIRIADARRTLRRYSELAAKHFVSREKLDSAANDVALSEAQLASDKSSIVSATRQMKLQQQYLASTRVVAPFDGVVTELSAHVGEIVSPISAGGGFTRTGICTIVNLDSTEAEADINEQYLGSLQQGQSVVITAQAYPGRNFSGKVMGLIPVVQRNTAAIKVRVSLDNTDHRLMPGMRIDLAFAAPASTAKSGAHQ